ncbi:MAG: type I restriction enzyme HsdR N-terminal domain-containing protein [Bacteroidales bacterium]|nr:type I restriction enzyme HsdR N-terminal domain-containing protein [Bacteroidales bacterium]
MKELNLPAYSFRFKSGDDHKPLIYDDIRKKFIVLTPEEWVRQNFVKYLINEKAYPAGLVAVEVMFKMNRLVKRADILVYDKKGEPLLIVECKAPSVKISAAVFDQIVSYNLKFRLKYIVVTNGMEHYACSTDPVRMKWSFLRTIPDYKILTGE